MKKVIVTVILILGLSLACVPAPEPDLGASLATPTDGSALSSTTPVLSWSGIGGPTSYRLQVASDSNFQNLVTDVNDITDIMYTVPSGTLDGDATYYWRVNATRGDLTSAWSASWSFFTPSAQPQPPQPPAGKASVQVQVTLDGAVWNGGIHYRITGPHNLSGTAVPNTFSNLPEGEYSITYQSGGPSGATLASITPSPAQDAGSGGAVSFTLNFHTESTSAITVNVTLNGSPWSGEIYYNIKGPFNDAESTAPKTLSGLPSGDYTLVYQRGGPAGAALNTISPSPSQHLGPSGGNIVYTLNFTTAPATGNVVVNATLDGSAWSGKIDYALSGAISDVEHSVPATISGVPSGYDCTLSYRSGGPANAQLVSISPQPTQQISTGQTVFVLNFHSQQVSGTITVNATLDGKAWQTAMGSGTINYTVVGPVTDSDSTIPQSFGNQPGGKYTLQYNSGGPIGATLTSITPSPTQNLTANNPNPVFTLNFSAQQRGTVSVQATLNGEPWSGPVGYVINGPYVESGSSVPNSVGNAPPGSYSVSYSSGGPPSAVFQGVQPGSQSLSPGGQVQFVIRFEFQGVEPEEPLIGPGGLPPEN